MNELGTEQTDHLAPVRQRLNAEERPHMPNPAAMQVHWLKLSRGNAKETRLSYGITVQGSAQISRKAYASGR